jgi:hypothetical protein
MLCSASGFLAFAMLWFEVLMDLNGVSNEKSIKCSLQ